MGVCSGWCKHLLGGRTVMQRHSLHGLWRSKAPRHGSQKNRSSGAHRRDARCCRSRARLIGAASRVSRPVSRRTHCNGAPRIKSPVHPACGCAERRPHVGNSWMSAERGDRVTAYDQVKVWEIDEVRPRPSRSSRPSRPQAPARTERRALRSEDKRERAKRRERAERNERLWVWARLSVVVILGAAVLWWPYGRSCGPGLAAYVAATAMIIVGGLWVVVCTWTCRMARTHAVAMLVALWGVGLIAVEVLPRIGYTAQSAAWLCGHAPGGTP